MLGPRLCARAFSSCGERGPLFIAMRGPLTIAASLVAEHRLQTCRLSSCGSRAQLLRGMWDLPRPGPEPVSPASAGRLSTTAPPGKPKHTGFLKLERIFILQIGKLSPKKVKWLTQGYTLLRAGSRIHHSDAHSNALSTINTKHLGHFLLPWTFF